MRRSRIRRLWLVGIAIVIVATFLGYRYGSQSTFEKERPVAVVKIRSTTRYGKILVSAGGFTLYTYKLDKKNHSECETFCLHVWPPFTVPGGVRPIGEGVFGLGTLLRSNGERQVTYEGMPLYHYVYDQYPGRVLGDSGWWSVVKLPASTS
jgi:predicted lipoprotein with Yx(FWY)xxD motif